MDYCPLGMFTSCAGGCCGGTRPRCARGEPHHPPPTHGERVDGPSRRVGGMAETVR